MSVLTKLSGKHKRCITLHSFFCPHCMNSNGFVGLVGFLMRYILGQYISKIILKDAISICFKMGLDKMSCPMGVTMNLL